MRLIALLLGAVLALGGCSGEAPAPATPPEQAATSAPPSPSEAIAATPAPSPTEAGPPLVAQDPAGLAGQLAEVETAIRDLARPLDELSAAGHLQQSAYRALARHPEWRDDVLSRVPEPLRGAVRANADAVADLVAMITPLPPGSRPSWDIVAPAPADELLAHYQESAAAFGIGWEYLAAIHLVETRMGRIRGTSSAGAQGPMQFMPGTWAQYGEGNVEDNRDAIMAAGRYLKAMGGPGDMDRALRRYNNSARYVRAIQAHAAVLRAEPGAYRGYYHWQVHYLTQEGDLWLPEGYPARPAVVPEG